MLLFRYFFISNSTKASTFNPIRYGSYTNKLWWRSQRTQQDFAIYLCRHQAILQKQKGQNCKVHPFGNNDFSFVFEIVVGKSQLSLHFAFCIFSFLTKCFLYVCLSWFNYLTTALESDDACVNRRWSLDNDTCTILVEDCWIEQNFTL